MFVGCFVLSNFQDTDNSPQELGSLGDEQVTGHLELLVGNELKGHDGINADKLRKLKNCPLDITERRFSV